jgi:hypothetical protein
LIYLSMFRKPLNNCLRKWNHIKFRKLHNKLRMNCWLGWKILSKDHPSTSTSFTKRP